MQPEGRLKATLKDVLPPAVADLGYAKAMAKGWLVSEKLGEKPKEEGETKKKEKGKKVEVPLLLKRKVEVIDDEVQRWLLAVSKQEEVEAKSMSTLKTRDLIREDKVVCYLLQKGPKFALEKNKAATDLTREMLSSGEWKSAAFKEYNFKAQGTKPEGGHLHPLLKVRAQFRTIFLEMGFEEMPTNNFVESSFWNFDALFQPQQHPARDSHDTFFLSTPGEAAVDKIPPDYLKRVQTVHESGGYGSVGYNCPWKLEEATKNLLRTHTTAVSSRMLYQLAQDGFQPKRYFSIDRVFRNEAVDKTHLAEFHQIEGVICERGSTLGDLIGMINDFFARLGIKKLRFKPAYNPYTEPSMEIFSYHEQLQRWVEIGNSGMFRPEMLEPMGMPPDVVVHGWGLSLERPTMILYGIDNIRDLFGHKVSDGGRAGVECRITGLMPTTPLSFCGAGGPEAHKEQPSVSPGLAIIVLPTLRCGC